MIRWNLLRLGVHTKKYIPMGNIIGLIINPIAGMGGEVALKGTDGLGILAEAIRRGAKPQAASKAVRALKRAKSISPPFTVLTCSGEMGEDACKDAGVSYQVVYQSENKSSPADTKCAANLLKRKGAAIILFVGGDGTARDMYDAVGCSVPVLGIPAGVKIQSSVFAITPDAAGVLVADLLSGRNLTFCEKEVVDLDEDSYREKHLSSSLYGYLSVPDHPKCMQQAKESSKAKTWALVKGAANYVIDKMEPDVYYAIGSGSSAKKVNEFLNLPYELLGIDVICNRRLLASDVTENQLWEYVQSGKMKIVVSPIGKQGFILGRGNHQFSPRVLSAIGKENIIVISSMEKIMSIPDRSLRVDCGDPSVDKNLQGYYCVLYDYARSTPLPCS